MNTKALIINVLIVVSTIIGVGAYFFMEADVLGSHGFGTFKYFTTDSNILMGIASLIYIPYLIKNKEIPHRVSLFKYMATVSVTITLLTVFLFLVPMAVMRGGIQVAFKFFEGNVFILHFSTPVLALITYSLFEKQTMLTLKDSLWATCPVIIYSFVYLFCVSIFHIWNDWYGFTFGGKFYLIPIVMIVMYVSTFIIANVVRKLNKTA